jgi:hypothetical protein
MAENRTSPLYLARSLQRAEVLRIIYALPMQYGTRFVSASEISTSSILPFDVTDGPLDRAALREVARLHRQSLPKAFLSSLGIGVLTEFYAGIQHFSGGMLIAARVGNNDQEIAGFAAGVDDVSAFHRWLTQRHFPLASVRLLPDIARLACSPRVWRKAGEVLFYPRRAHLLQPDLPPAEFLSLGVGESYRNQLLALRLYRLLVDRFRQRGVMAFRILVGSELHSVRRFHRAMGATEIANFELHSGSQTIVLVQSIARDNDSPGGHVSNTKP